MAFPTRRGIAVIFALATVTVVMTPASAFPATMPASSPVVPVVSFTGPGQLPESLAVDRQGTIYVSFPQLSQVLQIAPDGTQSTFATFPAGMRPLGVRLDATGNLVVAVVGSGVWRIPAGGGEPMQLAAIPGFPNGLAFDRRGNVFVSDTLGGVIYRIGRDGSVSIWASGPLLVGTTDPGPCGTAHPSQSPLGVNGLAFDRRGDALFASNTTLGTIVRIPVKRDGTAGTAVVHAGPDCALWGADGVAMDKADNLFVAANAERDVVRVDRAGRIRVIASIAAGDPLFSPSDIAPGARRGNRQQIFITNFAVFTGGVGAGVVTTKVAAGRPKASGGHAIRRHVIALQPV